MYTIIYNYADGLRWKTATKVFETEEEKNEWYSSYLYGNDDAYMVLYSEEKG